MTEAQKKAKELVDNFKPMVNGYVGSSMLTNTEYPERIQINATQCALICVDEILNTNYVLLSFSERYKFWEEVKH